MENKILQVFAHQSPYTNPNLIQSVIKVIFICPTQSQISILIPILSVNKNKYNKSMKSNYTRLCIHINHSCNVFPTLIPMTEYCMMTEY